MPYRVQYTIVPRGDRSIFSRPFKSPAPVEGAEHQQLRGERDDLPHERQPDTALIPATGDANTAKKAARVR